MAPTWLSVTVLLLGGRGEECWPCPGRVLAVGPSHTFLDLAAAINAAFARWDLAHLSLFTSADGRLVTDEETGAELTSSIGGRLVAALDMATSRVGRVLSPGAEFQFTFDLGDEWTHRCTVAEAKVDPLEVLGTRPERPVPYWGWGAIPDQYGRRWEDDDGSGRVPDRPSEPHPMLLHTWPDQSPTPTLDLRDVRGAIASGDAARLLAAISGRDVDDVLQQVGAGMGVLLARRRDAEPVVLSIINRLILRAADGDQVLADDLLAMLRGEPLSGRALPVDLELLNAAIEGDPEFASGAYLDLTTGEVYRGDEADSAGAGEDAIDLDADPDRWLWLDRIDSAAGWNDMAEFAAGLHDGAPRERMERAIEGAGAFRRFRDLVHEEGLAERWDAFTTDRAIGRARAALAGSGIRVAGARTHT